MHLPIWGQCPVFSCPKFPQGSWGVAAVWWLLDDIYSFLPEFPQGSLAWPPLVAAIACDCDVLVFWYGRKLLHFSISSHLWIIWDSRLLVHNITICYFYTFQSDHHVKSSYCLSSSYKDKTWLLTIFPTQIHLTHLFCYWKSVSLNLPHLISLFPPSPVLWLFSVSMTIFVELFVFTCFVFSISHKSEMQYLCFSDLFHLV